MTVNDLKAALSAVQINGATTVWAIGAWAHSPSTDYGVIEIESGNDLVADNRHNERGTVCYAHYFTRNATSAPRDAIENALNGLIACGWRLESVQYEDETQFLHYSWRAVIV